MKIVNYPLPSKGNVLPGLLAVVVVVLVIGGFYAFSQFSNFRVPAGYAGYMFNRPIFGQGKYEGVLFGPTSSCFRWHCSRTTRSCATTSVTVISAAPVSNAR